MMLHLCATLTNRCCEPNPRKGSLQPKWLCHRFPIKGGVRIMDTYDNRNRFLERWFAAAVMPWDEAPKTTTFEAKETE